MNVLIADKSCEVREQLKNLVSKISKDSEIQETESNLEAVSKLFKYNPSIVITDVDLCDGTGLDLLAFAANKRPKALIIVYTNHYKNNLRTLSLNIGADFYLFKSDDLTLMREILIQQEKKVLYS
ncbi:MAG TPA: hypothetical protein DHV28_09075 [Ignavibacteriales bacterium]|nr:hypothetical protein [Ignavibacteriales bacterium]